MVWFLGSWNDVSFFWVDFCWVSRVTSSYNEKPFDFIYNVGCIEWFQMVSHDVIFRFHFHICWNIHVSWSKVRTFWVAWVHWGACLVRRVRKPQYERHPTCCWRKISALFSNRDWERWEAQFYMLLNLLCFRTFRGLVSLSMILSIHPSILHIYTINVMYVYTQGCLFHSHARTSATITQ